VFPALDQSFNIALMRILILSFILLALHGCESKKVTQPEHVIPPTTTSLHYAEGFRVSLQDGCKLVEVLYPYQGATAGYKYLLVPKEKEIPAHDADVKIIRTPLASVVCTSTTHIPLLDYLDETNTLVGFPTTDYISSEKVRKRIDEGKVQELGVDKGINLERLAVLKPDMLMGYAMSSDYGQFKKMEELGVPVVINAEYLEKHPLGRAEWIKFMAVFFNREKKADSIFQIIEENYLATQKLVGQATAQPSVVMGIVYGDAWFLPGGQNYASKMLKDAGCNYLWSDNPSQGYLELSFESVFEKANKADLWIGVGTYASLREIEDADHRYAKFKAFQQKKVYTYDARRGAKGGSEFMELGYLRPDIILNDLVKIAHPELLPDYTLYFHGKLE
jgi:iron complex transport system substrate-binding protein